MSDAKAPERIWASYRKQPEQLYAYPWKGWEGNHLETEYVRSDLYDALAKERDELSGVIDRLKSAWSKAVDQCDAEYGRADKAEAEVERLQRAITSLRLDDDKQEFDAFDSGWNAALDALQRKEGNE